MGNYDEIKTNFESHIETLQSYKDNNQYRDFWNYRKTVVDVIKNSYLPREEKTGIWNTLNGIIDLARQEREEKEKIYQETVSSLEKELDNLEYDHTLSEPGPLSIKRYDTGSFFSHAKQVVELLKDSYLPKAESNRLWDRYKSLCSEVRTQQEELRNESTHNRDLLESRLNEAFNYAQGSQDRDDVNLAKEKIDEIFNTLKEYFLLKNDRDYCWTMYRDLKVALYTRRSELFDSNYHSLKNQMLIIVCLRQIMEIHMML